jgi:hypothetical protein
MAVGIAACGLLFADQRQSDWLTGWSSTSIPLLPLLPAAAFAGCLVAAFGLTTGRNLLARRPENQSFQREPGA